MIEWSTKYEKRKNMNTNTNRFAVEVATSNISEATQMVAFGFGYSWPGKSSGAKTPANTTARYLVFDPVTKTINWSSTRSEVEANVYVIVSSFNSLVGLFKTPPVNRLKVGSNIVVEADGTVWVGSQAVGSVLFDTLVQERQKFLKRDVKEPTTKRVAVVSFLYKSKTSGKKERKVAVTEWGIDWITGYDVEDKNAFKKFLRGSILSNPVMVGFVEVDA